MAEVALTPWVLPGVFGTAVAWLGAWFAWRRRPGPGAREFVVMALAVAWWCLMQVAAISAPDLPSKVLASKLQYWGIAAVPPAWLWFALAYTSRAHRVPRWGWALLLAPQLVTLLLAWTNEWHGLIWERLTLVPASGFLALDIEHGAWFAATAVYSYGLIVVAMGVLTVALTQARNQRKRLVAVLTAPLFVAAANLSYLVGLTPPRWIDLTPTGLALGGVVLAWSLLRADLLGLPPVARGKILEAIHEGIVVIDSSGKVVDLNAAASRLLGVRLSDSLPDAFFASDTLPSPRTVEQGGRMLELSRSPTSDVPGGGTIVVIRDVSEQHRLQAALRDMGDELRESNRELTKLANTDGLTGLANRRHFLRVLEQELRRSARYGHPVGLLLLDIDHFKEINDSLGHGAGDAVLRGLSEAIEETVRDVDVVGRLGGDEIAVMLPETDTPGAGVTAQRILSRVAAGSYTGPDSRSVAVTVSVGVVAAESGDVDFEGLLHAADVALYRAKAEGRNRIATAHDEDPLVGSLGAHG